MKRYIKKILCVSAITVAVFLLLNAAYFPLARIDSGYYDLEFNKINENTKITIANTGNSHSRLGINYESLVFSSDVNCFNLALDAQSLSYDNRILQNYSENFQKGGVLIVSISYYSLSNEEKKVRSFASRNLMYYYFLKDEYIVDFKQMDAIGKRRFPLLTAQNNLFEVIAARLGYQEVGFVPPVTEEEFQKNGVDFANINFSDELRQNIIDGSYSPANENVVALTNIISFCEEKDITPIFITIPYTSYYLDNIPEPFFDQFDSSLRTILGSKYSNYYDYSQDKRFTENIEYFRDSSHLNSEGAKFFTKIIFDEIEELHQYIENE